MIFSHFFHKNSTFSLHLPADEPIKSKINWDDDILDIEFSSNGDELWITFKDSQITVIETANWHVTKIVPSERFQIKSFSRLPTSLTQDIFRRSLKSLWIGLTNSRELVFLYEKATDSAINIKSCQPWKLHAVKHFTVSPDVQMLALISADGVLKIYSMETLLCQTFRTIQTDRTAIEQQLLEIKHDSRIFDKKVRNAPTNRT